MPTSILQTFKNDYNQSCHPVVMQALACIGLDRHAGYGLDEISVRTADLVRKQCKCPQAQVHFIAGGTLTNLLTISTFLRPHQAVIAVESGHIAVHETGAIEATGHKILTAQSDDGKLKPEHIEAICETHNNEHMVQAKLVYISQSTELGTVYSKTELAAIANTCKILGLYLFLDGARLGAAMASNDDAPSLEHVAKLCDAFYIGGTKNGALFGEALVLVHEDIQKDFRYLCKQRGALLAKGWLISAQFEALLQNNLYYELAQNANRVARYLDAELRKLGIDFFVPTCTNQIFPIISANTANILAKSYAFETWQVQGQEHVIRFVTSFSTTMDDADKLLQTLKEILQPTLEI